MSSSPGHDEIPGALDDVSNAPDAPQSPAGATEEIPQAPQAPKPTPAQRAAMARERGWAEPTPLEYARYADTKGNDYEWAGSATRYEWKEEYGDIGPRNEELENMLFHHDLIPRAGNRFSDYQNLHVVCESENRFEPITRWKDAGLHPIMLQNIDLCLYAHPTPIQCYVLPAMTFNRDIIGIAATGSGKTGAFLIPIISQLMGKAKRLAAARPDSSQPGFNPETDGVRAEPLVLIVCPTRELATQIFDEARRLCYRSMLRPCVVYGGAPARYQRAELKKGCDILVGTTGRLIDFMNQPHVLSLRRVRYTVIDEADEMLDPGWEDDFQKIMSGGDINEDADHRYLMFSATFNRECRKLARTYLGQEYIRVRIGRAGSAHLQIQQVIILVLDHLKQNALLDLLCSVVPIRTLIFCNNRTTVDALDDLLFNNGFPVTSMHSGRTQKEREDSIRAFKTGKSPIMVATGISARGLDIINVMHVINYDLPTLEHGGINEYVHRIGRTARIGNEGLATSFYNERNEELGPDLVKILIESKQDVPEFLAEFAPSDSVDLRFDDTTDSDEAEEIQNAGTDAADTADAEDEAVHSDTAGEDQWERDAKDNQDW